MQGRRIPDDEWFHWQADGLIQPGDYGKISGDVDAWLVCAPNGQKFQLCNATSPDPHGRVHEVDEHEDGTISVEPKLHNSNSIGAPPLHGVGWHGYIRHGVWEPC